MPLDILPNNRDNGIRSDANASAPGGAKATKKKITARPLYPGTDQTENKKRKEKKAEKEEDTSPYLGRCLGRQMAYGKRIGPY